MTYKTPDVLKRTVLAKSKPQYKPQVGDGRPRKGSPAFDEPVKQLPLRASTLEDICRYCGVQLHFRISQHFITSAREGKPLPKGLEAFDVVVICGRETSVVHARATLNEMGFVFSEARNRDGYHLTYPVADMLID